MTAGDDGLMNLRASSAVYGNGQPRWFVTVKNESDETRAWIPVVTAFRVAP